MISDLRDTNAEVNTDGNTDTADDAVCATCPHPWSNHDQIATRYCTASKASGQDQRGCVCTGKTAT